MTQIPTSASPDTTAIDVSDERIRQFLQEALLRLYIARKLAAAALSSSQPIGHANLALINTIGTVTMELLETTIVEKIRREDARAATEPLVSQVRPHQREGFAPTKPSLPPTTIPPIAT